MNIFKTKRTVTLKYFDTLSGDKQAKSNQVLAHVYKIRKWNATIHVPEMFKLVKKHHSILLKDKYDITNFYIQAYSLQTSHDQIISNIKELTQDITHQGEFTIQQPNEQIVDLYISKDPASKAVPGLSFTLSSANHHFNSIVFEKNGKLISVIESSDLSTLSKERLFSPFKETQSIEKQRELLRSMAAASVSSIQFGMDKN